jgi:hypothetical protein
MHRNESVHLLLQRANLLAPGKTLDESSPSDRANASAIAEALGDFPLALNRVGAYIEEKKCSLATFLEIMNLLNTSNDYSEYCGSVSPALGNSSDVLSVR